MKNDKIKEQIGLLKNIQNYLAISIIGSLSWLILNVTKTNPIMAIISISLIFVLVALISRLFIHAIRLINSLEDN